MELCVAIPLLGYNTPTSVIPTLVYYSVPTEKEFKWAVQRLRGNRLGVT